MCRLKGDPGGTWNTCIYIFTIAFYLFYLAYFIYLQAAYCRTRETGRGSRRRGVRGLARALLSFQSCPVLSPC